MPELRLLADMNVSPDTVKRLREHGWDVARIPERLPVNASDTAILDLARLEGRVVVSHDLDFSTLLALGGHDRPSLITLRLALTDPPTVAERLLQTLPGVEKDLHEGAAVTVEDARVRVRKLPIQ